MATYIHVHTCVIIFIIFERLTILTPAKPGSGAVEAVISLARGLSGSSSSSNPNDKRNSAATGLNFDIAFIQGDALAMKKKDEERESKQIFNITSGFFFGLFVSCHCFFNRHESVRSNEQHLRH